MNYQEIYYKNEGRVSHKIEHYFSVYNRVWSKFINQSATVLEIGVQNGGGLQIAKEYFVNANIYGIDIEPKVCKMFLGSNITTYCFDAKDKISFDNYFGDMSFDTILDDGSHINSDIIQTFRNLFSKIRPGGVYVVEDIHTAYWKTYGGGYLKNTTAIEFFKGFVDLLNAYYINKNDDIQKNQEIKHLSAEDYYIFQWLESVSFYDSMVVIHKLDVPRAASYKNVISGYVCEIDCIASLGFYRNSSADLEKVISRIKDINMIGESGGTLLYMFAQNNEYEVVKALLNAKADVNIKAVNNLTPLYVSIQDNNYPIVKLLLEHGANTEIGLPSGSTPLFAAAYLGHDEILKLLIGHGANKNVSVDGMDAFQAALGMNHPSSAIILAGSQEIFCQQIQSTEYEIKYADLCGEIKVEF